jgi:hypothetical protein
MWGDYYLHGGSTMTNLRLIVITLAASMLLSGSLVAEDQEKKINRSELPAAVNETVRAQSQGATIRGFSQEKENGKTFYEAELMVNGRSKDVLIDAGGEVVEVEEQVSLENLPAVVRTGLETHVGKGKLGKVESLTKKGKLVAYEAQVLTDGKRSEIQVGPDGKPLAHEE